MKKELGVYVHIPFCDHKCIYCDFYSIIKYDNAERYLKNLIKEIKHYSEIYTDSIVTTIYFGGGTPSLMSSEYISRIINEIIKCFNIVANPEITLETNPGTVDKEKIKEFLSVGINRISIGVQSFNDEELKFLTRIHNSKTAIKTIEEIAEIGCENISADLIFNLPNQSYESWMNNLKQVTNLPLKHISAYSLILEKGTILNKMVLDGKIDLQGEEFDADLYEKTIDYLQEYSFIQYEVSNFTKEGFECKHNLIYWNYYDYLSFGTSAHSFVNMKRWWNYSSLNLYNIAMEEKGNAIAGSEQISLSSSIDEYIMMSLRSKGIEKDRIEKFDPNFLIRKRRLINDLKREGYITESEKFIKFTKKGYLISDEIILSVCKDNK